MRTASELIERFRQPEYTGENRCLPCTVLNAAIAVLIALGVGALSPPAGLVVLAVAGATIYLRGYLVPGTPALTERYLPERVLALFGKASTRSPTLAVDDAGWGDLERAGIATRGPAGVRLDDDFRERWRRGMRDVRDRDLGANDVAAIAGVDDVDRQGELSFVVGGDQLLRWDSEPALVADRAAAAALREGFDGWDELDRSTRRDLLLRLRFLLDRCPACDASVAIETERMTHCCRKTHVAVAALCTDCDALLAEVVTTDPIGEGWDELPAAETVTAD